MKGSRSRYTAFVCLALIAGGSVTAQAQTAQPTGIPGPNVNIIGPTPYPPGVTPIPGSPSPLIEDLQLKQKNEPQCAVRPDEPRHFFCIYNDYRGVDTPTIGDSWIGASMSRDEGLTWLSRLVPGFPNDTLQPSLNLAFAADPMIAAVPGLALVGFLAANRDGNQPGGLFIQRWVELTKEDGFPWAYADTKRASSGTSGQFRDKPAMLATLASPGTAPLTLNLVVNGQAVAQKVAAGTLHVAYSNFTGSDPKDSSQIRYLKSTDYGATWTNEVKLSSSVALNQGVSIAADPTGQNLVVVWRSFDFNSNQPNSIVYSASSNGGNSWSNPKTLGPSFICPFDQDVTDTQFRSKALPQVVNDGTKFYVFWAQRQGTGTACQTGQSRIVYLTSNATGTTWGNTPKEVAPFTGGGHQFMPAATAAGGFVQVVWYDTREDEYYNGSPTLDSFVSDSVVTNPAADNIDPVGQPINRRHTADLWQVQIKGTPQLAVKVSQYAQGTFGTTPNVQLERNYVNARIFRQGSAPFIGDYIAATAPAFRLNSAGQWISNIGAPSASDRAPAEPTFQVAWADNRHIRSNVFLNPGAVTGYTPPVYNLQGEPGDPSGAPQCVPTDPLKALSRAQRIFSSVIKPGVLLSAPAPTKRSNATLQRAHVIQLQNLTYKVPNASNNDPNLTQQEVRQYQVELSLPNQPANGDSASFVQFGAALTVLDVRIPEGSSAARSVFVTPGAGRPAPVVVVNVFECTNSDINAACARGARVASLALNGNPLAGNVLDPECATGGTCYPAGATSSIQVFEAHNPDLTSYVYSVESPSYRNPSLRNPSLRNQTYESPSLRNQTIESPSLRNPSLRNSPLTDSGAAAAGSYTDFVYTVENDGNTTTGYNLAPLITGDDSAGLLTQLIVSRVYPEPYAFGCDFSDKSTLETQQVVVNIVNPDVTAAASEVDPLADPGANAGPDDATFLVEPGGKAQITLRVWGVEAVKADQLFRDRVWMKVYAQAVNTNGFAGQQGFDVIGCVGCAAPDVAAPQLPPTAPPPLNSTLPIEANSPGGWLPNYATPVATDAVDGDKAKVTCDIPSGSSTAYPIGKDRVVTCTATDRAGNSSVQQYKFGVADTLPPTLTAPSGTITVPSTEPGKAFATVVYPNPVSATDVVGLAAGQPSCTATAGVTSADLTKGGTFPIGTSTVTCTAIDTSGNSTSQSFKVTVADTEPPVLSVPAPIFVNTDTGKNFATVGFVVTAVDNSGFVESVTCSSASTGVGVVNAAGGTFPVGTSTVTCTAIDRAVPANSTSKSFDVTVKDAEPPVVTVPANMAVEATSSAGAPGTFAASASDVVDGAVATTCSPASGSTFAIGTTTVTCSATDAAGNTGSATFTVTVGDTTKPTVTPPSSVVVEATSAAGATVTYAAATFSDAVGVVSSGCTPASGSTFAIGATTVTCSATDGAGNTGTASFTVTVTDTTRPVVTVPANITAEATGASGAVVSFTASATDSVSGSIATTCTPASGSTFTIGATPVTCNAADAAGNTSTATFTVTVRDTTPPTGTQPADIVAEASSAAGAVVTYTLPAFSDAVGVVSSSCMPASGSTFALGTTTVNCGAKDAAGNTGTKSFTVTVRDTTAPSLTVPANITTTTSGTTAAVTYSVTATDLVGVTSLTCSSSGVSGVSPTGGTFPVGTSTVSCTAKDAANNSTSKSFTVTVNKAGYAGLDGVYANGSKSAGSAVPLDFGFTGTSGARVDSSLARPSVKVYYAGKSCPGTRPATPTFTYPSGSSDYRYSASALNWQFNWKPSVNGLGAGCYYVAVKSEQTGQEFNSTKGTILLTK